MERRKSKSLRGGKGRPSRGRQIGRSRHGRERVLSVDRAYFPSDMHEAWLRINPPVVKVDLKLRWILLCCREVTGHAVPQVVKAAQQSTANWEGRSLSHSLSPDPAGLILGPQLGVGDGGEDQAAQPVQGGQFGTGERGGFRVVAESGRGSQFLLIATEAKSRKLQ